MESKVDLENSNTEWISDNTYVYSTQPFKLLRKEIVDMKKPFDDTGDFHSFKIDMITLCWAEKTDLTKYKYAGIVKEIDQDGKQYVLPKRVPYDIIKYSISKIVLEKPTAEFMKKIFKKKKAEEIFEYDPDTPVFFKNKSSLISKLRKITGHERVYSKEADKVFRKRCNKQTEYIKKINDGEVILLLQECALKTVISALAKKYGHFITIRRALPTLKLFSVFDIDDTVIFHDGRKVDATMLNFIKTLRTYGKIIYLTARKCRNDESFTTLTELRSNGLWEEGDVLKCIGSESGLISVLKWTARQELKETYGTEIVNVGDQLSDHMKHDDYYNFLKILQQNTKINKILSTDEFHEIRGDPDLMLTNLKKLTFTLVYKTKDDDVLHIKLKNLNEFVL